MDKDRLERLDRLGRYERYLRYIQMMDSMDMLEELCDSSMPMGQASCSAVPFSRNAFKRRKLLTKLKEDSEVEEESEDELEGLDSSDVEYETEEESDESETNTSVEAAKKKPSIDFENPYRGLKDSENPMEALNDTDFLNSYKFSKKTIVDVMEMIKDHLIKYSNRGVPVPPLIALLITVNYLTMGSGQKDAMKGVSQSSISRINTRVTDLISSLQDRFVKMPDKEEIEKNKLKFFERGRFPDVIACVRSTHVGVRVKGIEKNYISSYVNENGYHSVRVQIIVGPDGEIYNVVSKYPGSIHENKIFAASLVNQMVLNGEIHGVILGNHAYNPTTVVMTTVKTPQHTGEYYYNEALSKTYTATECVIEWKKRFRCLQTFLACVPKTQQNIIMCCAILHNIAKLNKDPLPVADAQSVVIEVKGKKDCPKKRIDVPMIENIAIAVRDEFIRKHFPMYYGNPAMSYLSL